MQGPRRSESRSWWAAGWDRSQASAPEMLVGRRSLLDVSPWSSGLHWCLDSVRGLSGVQPRAYPGKASESGQLLASGPRTHSTQPGNRRCRHIVLLKFTVTFYRAKLLCMQILQAQQWEPNNLNNTEQDFTATFTVQDYYVYKDTSNNSWTTRQTEQERLYETFPSFM